MVLQLVREHGEDRVAAAAREALKSTSPRFDTVLLCLTRQSNDPIPAVPVTDQRLADIVVPQPFLGAYDQIGEVAP